VTVIYKSEVAVVTIQTEKDFVPCEV